MKKVLLLVMVELFVAACTTSQPAPTESPEDVVIEVGEVIFDGRECTVTGETKLPPGKFSYVLQDESDYEVQMYIGRLLGDKTMQDMLDLQGEPGSRGNVTEALLDEAYDWAIEPGAAWQKPDGGEVHTYILVY